MTTTISDREALLLGCLENPEDAAPLLIFADWLDDHGEEGRAAHVRALVGCRWADSGIPDDLSIIFLISPRCLTWRESHTFEGKDDQFWIGSVASHSDWFSFWSIWRSGSKRCLSIPEAKMELWRGILEQNITVPEEKVSE